MVPCTATFMVSMAAVAATLRVVFNDFSVFKHFVNRMLMVPRPCWTLLLSRKYLYLSKAKSSRSFGRYQPLSSSMWYYSSSSLGRTIWHRKNSFFLPSTTFPLFSFSIRTCCSSLLGPKSFSAPLLPSSSSCNNRRYHNDNNSDRAPLKLMDCPELIWPSPIKSFRNWWFSKLIKGYYDNTFTMESFLAGAEQAIHHVSNCLAEGDFEELKDIVEPAALQEIQNNYADLSISQRNFLAIKPEDLFLRFIYEIGMMFDDAENQRFVEITVVFQGFHGFHNAKQKDPREYYDYVKENTKLLYVCNYRFIREFTKGATSDDWIINKLNHFVPNELTLR